MLKNKDPQLIKINRWVNKSQYIFFMMLIYTYYLVVSIVLVPIAYLVSIGKKINAINSMTIKIDIKSIILDHVLFFIFGLGILSCNIFSDAYYFLVNNFRDDLKMIIVQKDDFKVSHNSLKLYLSQNYKYSDNKIKSLSTNYLIKVLRNRFRVKKNLQFLIFGQDIKKGTGLGDGGRHATFKSLKTVELRDEREAEKEMLDDTIHIEQSKYALEQFSQLKKIMLNFSFKNKGKNVLSAEINYNIIDELRHERKITMVIRDLRVDEYIR